MPNTFNVPVTLDDAATKPPKSIKVLVAIEPRFDTVSNVSDSEELGQPTPLLKQMPTPETVAVAKLAVLAYKNVEVTVLSVPVVADKNVPVVLKKLRFETVPVATERISAFNVVPVPFKKPSVVFTNRFVAVELPSAARDKDNVVPVAPEKKRFVVVTLVPVAFVKNVPCMNEVPVTLNVPIALSVPVTLEDAATNPPKNCAVVVVKLPRAVAD
jgi:hypothetical protein